MRILDSVITKSVKLVNLGQFRTISVHPVWRKNQGNSENLFSIEPEYQSDPALNPDQHRKLLDSPNFQQGQKFLRVCILGVPNAGKSTLINQLVGGNACPHSKKHHTTRLVFSCCARAFVFIIARATADKYFCNFEVSLSKLLVHFSVILIFRSYVCFAHQLFCDL